MEALKQPLGAATARGQLRVGVSLLLAPLLTLWKGAEQHQHLQVLKEQF